MDPHRAVHAGVGADVQACAARHPRRNLAGPARTAGRGGRRGPLPGLGGEQLRVRSDHRRQWRLVDVMKLAGRVTIVTGGALGIGKAIATACAREGARIVLCDIAAPAIAAAEAEIRALGASVLSLRVDVTDSAQVAAMVETVLKTWGRVDILVNNAGGGIGPKGLTETRD